MIWFNCVSVPVGLFCCCWKGRNSLDGWMIEAWMIKGSWPATQTQLRQSVETLTWFFFVSLLLLLLTKQANRSTLLGAGQAIKLPSGPSGPWVEHSPIEQAANQQIKRKSPNHDDDDDDDELWIVGRLYYGTIFHMSICRWRRRRRYGGPCRLLDLL